MILSRIPVLALGLGLLLAADAPAATVSYDPGTGLRIAAAAGEQNVITSLTDLRGSQIQLQVTDTGAGPTAGPGCTAVAGRADTVQCETTVGQGGNLVVTTDLGDGSDSFDATGFSLLTADQFITAGPGDDTVISGRGFDAIDLGAGNDVVRPGGGNDNVKAGDGNDVVSGSEGSDTLDGGAGADTLDYQRSAVPRVAVFLDGSKPTQKLDLGQRLGSTPRGTDTVLSFNTLIGTENGDILVGSDDVERIEGRGGPDLIYGDVSAFQRFNRDASRIRTCCFTTTFPSKTSSGGTTQPARVTTVPRPNPALQATVRRGDALLGGLATDEVYGSARDDDINGEAGTDLIRGLDGADVIFARDGEGDDIRCGGGADGLTVDLRDVFEEDHDCESVDEGALREGRHVVLGPRAPRLSRGMLHLTVSCPPTVRQGCRGTLRARAGGRTGRATSYRVAAGRRATVTVRVPAGGRTFRLTSVERGLLGLKTTIRTLER